MDNVKWIMDNFKTPHVIYNALCFNVQLPLFN